MTRIMQVLLVIVAKVLLVWCCCGTAVAQAPTPTVSITVGVDLGRSMDNHLGKTTCENRARVYFKEYLKAWKNRRHIAVATNFRTKAFSTEGLKVSSCSTTADVLWKKKSKKRRNRKK